MLVAFQYFDNALDPRQILLIRNVVMHKANKHKHQREKDQHAKKRMQDAPHLRSAEGFRQPLERREKERNTG
ncbi:hypothetical protein D3C87_2164010 [compost metagenome]